MPSYTPSGVGCPHKGVRLSPTPKGQPREMRVLQNLTFGKFRWTLRNSVPSDINGWVNWTMTAWTQLFLALPLTKNSTRCFCHPVLTPTWHFPALLTRCVTCLGDAFFSSGPNLFLHRWRKWTTAYDHLFCPYSIHHRGTGKGWRLYLRKNTSFLLQRQSNVPKSWVISKCDIILLYKPAFCSQLFAKKVQVHAPADTSVWMFIHNGSKPGITAVV